MQLARNSVLAVLVLVFAVVHAAPQANVTTAAVTEPVPSAGPAEEKDIAETTLNPTRAPNVPSETPMLVHSSTPPPAPPAEEKTTKAAATMQSAPEKPDGGPSTLQTENQKGSATTHNHVYPLVFSTAAVVLFSAFSLV